MPFFRRRKERDDSDLLKTLEQVLEAEKESVAHHERLERRLVSPWMKERLRRLAQEDREHISIVAEKIRALGGNPTLDISHQPPYGSLVEDLIKDWEDERNLYERLREEMALLPEGEIKQLLAKIREEERSHVELLRDLITRYD